MSEETRDILLDILKQSIGFIFAILGTIFGAIFGSWLERKRSEAGTLSIRVRAARTSFMGKDSIGGQSHIGPSAASGSRFFACTRIEVFSTYAQPIALSELRFTFGTSTTVDAECGVWIYEGDVFHNSAGATGLPGVINIQPHHALVLTLETHVTDTTTLEKIISCTMWRLTAIDSNDKKIVHDIRPMKNGQSVPPI